MSRIRIRLENIRKKATRSVSFSPTEVAIRPRDYYLNATMTALEDVNGSYHFEPSVHKFLDDWNVYAYDESVQSFHALEGELLFFSSSTIKIDQSYSFNLTVTPYFLTGMKKFRDQQNEDIRFSENILEERNRIMVTSKVDSILNSVEPRSIVLIDGPLLGGNVSAYTEKMDACLRKRDCIPLYFVKNSDSRLIVDSNEKLSTEFNSDFHWSACTLPVQSRSALFRYTEENVSRHSKVFTYVKALYGFPERIEMHPQTYQRYRTLIPELMDFLGYLYILQGERLNPQVRPIAIAEKYAREGIRVLNIPTLLSRLGFKPTINQVRFGD